MSENPGILSEVMNAPLMIRRTLIFLPASHLLAILSASPLQTCSQNRGHTFIDDPTHLQLRYGAKTVNEQDDLVRPVVLERDERAVCVGRIDDLGQHLVDQLSGSSEGVLGSTGLVVDAHTEFKLVLAEMGLAGLGTGYLVVSIPLLLFTKGRLASGRAYMTVV